MAWTTKPGTGALFRNREKKNDRQPNLKGEAVVEIAGQLHTLELAAWSKESERAGKWLALTVKLKGDRTNQRRPTTTTAGRQRADQDLDDAFGGDADDGF
jgi:hypothetical protein